jgi:hypothetical protein
MTRFKRESKPKKVLYFNGTLACQRYPQHWIAVDLNPERKVVLCPTCGEPNDISKAIAR